MTIQPIGNTSVALYITPTDLKERGLTPDSFTLEQALELTRAACVQAGMTLEGSLEIEAYPDLCGVLVFARVSRPERIWFSFGDAEPLLAAAHSLPEPRPDGALYWWQGRYWLSLPAGEVQAAHRLAEFGRAERLPPPQQARLDEYGQQLIETKAPERLTAIFSG